MKKIRIRFFKFPDGKQNLQFHWPNIMIHDYDTCEKQGRTTIIE